MKRQDPLPFPALFQNVSPAVRAALGRSRPRPGLRWALAVMAVLGLVSAGWGGTASGRLLYVDKVHDFSSVGAGYVGTASRAARFVEVELRRSDNASVLGSGSTDGEGYFSFSVQSAGTLDVDLYVIGRSTHSPWTEIEVQDRWLFGRIQTVVSGPYERDTNTSFTLDYTVPADGGGVRLGGIFNIIDTILSGAELVSVHRGARVPPCVVYWEHGSADGTYYRIGTNEIHLLGGSPDSVDQGDDDSYDDAVILHEYGHYLTDLYSYISPSAYGSHLILGNHHPALTWSEGWVSAFQAFARNSPLYWDSLDGDTGGFNLGYERGTYNEMVRPEFRGMNNEAAVTCVLYDLFDDASSIDTSPGQDDESWAFGAGPVWQVVEGDFAPGVLATMDDFYQGWQDRFPEWSVDPAFAAFGMEFVPHEESESVWSRVDMGLSIPDGDVRGASDTLAVALSPGERLLSGGVRVWVALQHPNPEQIVVRLKHPDGTAVLLRAYGTANTIEEGSTTRFLPDVWEWYGYSTYKVPAESLSVLTGKSPSGPWVLEVSDELSGGSGILRDWRLKLNTVGPLNWWQVY